jgi:hypothetical protein
MMPSIAIVSVLLGLLGFVLHRFVISSLILNPLSRIPGPKTFALTKWRLALEDWTGNRTRKINELHQKYGPAVRIGPNEVAFNSLSAMRIIYGAGSGFERTPFYDMFDAYGKKNLFTFQSVKDHSERKKLVAHAYSKSVMLKGHVAKMIQSKSKEYMDLLKRGESSEIETFTSLHYFALDTITEFLYAGWGSTKSMAGVQRDQALLNDIVDVSRRKLSWFAVHFPLFTKWMYSRTGLAESVVRYIYPMQKPTTYSGIRGHALQSYKSFAEASLNGTTTNNSHPSILERLWTHHESQKAGGLDDTDIASECADHLLAGIDTTSDTLMFLIWALSRPQNRRFQQNLIVEVDKIADSDLDEHRIPSPEACDKLPYLDAIIKETLRVYAPLPASEPRSFPTSTIVDGYELPARTVVSMSPFSLHRNAEVFKDPLVFNPERWLDENNDLGAMKRWFWAFSSGGRKCIGLHLAMAEMITLVVSIYRTYTTSINSESVEVAPGITSRFEIFHDDTLKEVRVCRFPS